MSEKPFTWEWSIERRRISLCVFRGNQMFSFWVSFSRPLSTYIKIDDMIVFIPSGFYVFDDRKTRITGITFFFFGFRRFLWKNSDNREDFS